MAHFLVVATAWGARHGGINSFNVAFCEELTRAGQMVTCLVADGSKEDIEAAAKNGVVLTIAETGPGLDSFQRLLLGPPDLPLGVDYVVGHGRITGPMAYQIRRRLFSSAKYVHFVHMHPDTIDGEKESPTPDYETRKRMITELTLLVHAILPVAVGPRLTAFYTPDLAVRRPGRAIHQFVPGLANLGNGAPSSHDTCRILVVGRPEDNKLKGIDYSVQRVAGVCQKLRGNSSDAPANLLANRIQLHIIGAADDAVARAEENRHRKQLSFTRVKVYSVDREELAMELKAAALVLMLSTEEGFGLSALEALSVGTPILVSARSGFAETLLGLGTGQESAYILDRDGKSADDLAERAIIEILKKLPEHRGRIEQLRAAYDAEHSWSRSVTKFLEELRAASSAPDAQEGGGTVSISPGTLGVLSQLAAISAEVLSTIEVPNGRTWIERAEERELQLMLADHTRRPIALLGAPGSGKSALIAQAARALGRATVGDEFPPLLVLKAVTVQPPGPGAVRAVRVAA